MKIISVTGTKGKTFLVSLLDYVLRSLGKKTVCISSRGFFIDGKKVKSNDYFIQKYGTSANVAGLKELERKNFTGAEYLILESSYSSTGSFDKSKMAGKVDMAVLTNVYWDHIDGKNIRNQSDLLKKKIQVIKNTRNGGAVLIFVGDNKDSFSQRAIKVLEKERPDLKLIAYDRKYISSRHLSERLFLKDDAVYLNNEKLLDYGPVPMKFKHFSPAVDLGITALAGILGKLELDPQEILKIKNENKIVPGRLNVFEKNGYSVVLDCAHELKSLQASSRLVREYFAKPVTTAVVRLSYFRTDEYINQLTRAMASLFDSFIIYDKAVSRKNLKKIFEKRYRRKAGDVARLMKKKLVAKRKKSVVVYDEIAAIKRGIRNLKKNELLYIMGDQIGADIKAIKEGLTKKGF